jgi:RNA polymerase sigma factor (TIGR02999 family)
LHELTGGDTSAEDRLTPHVYAQLRAIAARRLRDEWAGHSLQPTDLVHEAYSALIDLTRSTWQDRAYFLALAAKIMRQILVDHARKKRTAKRGGGRARVPLGSTVALASDEEADVADLHESLLRLAEVDPRITRGVEMRYFAGMTVAEIACVLGVAERTVEKDWAFARAWLQRDLSK